MLSEVLLGISRAERVAAVEDRKTGTLRKADFEGSVSGVWQGLDELGAGKVLYEGKVYTTKRLGFTSLFKGDQVQLSYLDGVYYSSW